MIKIEPFGPLATGITRALSIDTAIAEPVQPHRDGAQDPQAYKAYLRGKYVFDHMNSASDVDIALGLYRQAVSLEPALVEAYAGIGEVLLHQGKYDPAIRELQAGLAEARQRGRRPDEVAILKLLSRAHDRLGNWQEALDEGHRAVEIARDLGDLAGEADSLGQIISVLRKQSKNDLAMAMFQRVVEINRQLDDHEKILSALFEMGTLYVNMNDHTRARGLFEEALGAAQEQGNQSLIAQGMTLVGAACVREGNYSEGMRYFREGLEIGRRIGDQDRIGECTADIGIIHVIWGEYHEALKYLEAAVEMAHAAGSRRAKAISLISLAHAEGMLGKYDRAITHATEAASIAGDLNLSDISVLAMNCVGDMHLYHGDHERAARQFKDAITFAEKTETRILVDSSLIGLATAFTQALASSASLACAERALKEAAKSNDPSARFISSAYIGAAEVRLHDFESGIEKLYDSYSEAQKNGDFYEELRVQRLLGEALFHNAPTSHDREQGRRILQNALASATAREVPHEIRWINKILSSSE
ncbi:MAG: tetratricopeptide repeat protein [candidate division Zixibacteria bacterium]|nr:tetratricopeptide repeat protein [candidate division Zixibacteria bacterium]